MKNIDLVQTINTIANLGVIAGILLLAVELRQNNEMQAANARNGLLENRTDGLAERFRNPQLASAYVKARQGEALSEMEEFYLAQYYRWVVVNWEWEYEQLMSGLIAQSQYPDHSPAFREWPKFQEAWDAAKPVLSPEFVSFTEENLARQ